jgi:pimeloyl-ACP methyl ester carboxylesterase
MRGWRAALAYLVIACALPCAAGANGFFVDEPVFGSRVYVIEAGRGHARPIVLVHGLGDHASRIWDDLIPVLAREFHVLAFDLPGFGRSSKANKLYSPEQYAAFIHFLTQRYLRQPFMLVGHSMGGNIALYYATAYPREVERLLLVDVAGILHRVAYSQFLAHFGLTSLPPFLARQQQGLQGLAASVFGSVKENSRLVELGERMVLHTPLLREKFLRAEPAAIAAYAMMMTDYSARLPQVQAPTLVLWGGRDQVAPLRTAKVLATNIPQAGLVVFEAAGHVPMRDEPARFTRWLVDYARAKPAQRDTLLASNRYALDHTRQWTLLGDATCHYQSRRVFEGDYRHIEIVGCRSVLLRRLRAQRVTIRQSRVQLENCVITSDGTALHIETSEVEITGCQIVGNTAIAFVHSKLDIAGTQLRGESYGMQQLPDPTPSAEAPSGATSVLFSVSRVRTAGVDRSWHGVMPLHAGQGR